MNLQVVRGRTDLLALNRRFYDRLWTEARLARPDRFSTWPLVRSLLAGSPARLEIAPGLRPRLPIQGTCFLDISLPALARLHEQGGVTTCGTASALPLPDRHFGLLCALDVVEHVEDDTAAFAELARVALPGAVLLLSVPLHRAAWSAFDEIVGHGRRYEPVQLVAALAEHGFAVERSAAFGMRPRSSRLLAVGMWFLARRPAHAMKWYNRLLFPLALRRQKPLALHDGVMETEAVQEIFLVCRRTAADPRLSRVAAPP
jgi:SAM-dependent methyltransferase